MYYKLQQEILDDLIRQFLYVGYNKEAIDEIATSNGATEIEQYIQNLENEKSYWSD